MENIKKSNKKPLIMLALVFIVPVFAAKLVLDNGWYTGGVNNNGELLKAPISLSQDYPKGKWHLLQTQANCSQLSQLNNIKRAIGREQDRVQLAVINHDLSKQCDLAATTIAVELTPEASQYPVLIIDPLGNIIMGYQDASNLEPQQFALHGKAILRDMKKLLKLSKVG